MERTKWGDEIIVNIPDNSQIITKNCYGLSSEDILKIKNAHINEIEICGTDIDACCLAIAFNLFDNNIKPIILSNLCASSSSNKEIYKRDRQASIQIKLDDLAIYINDKITKHGIAKGLVNVQEDLNKNILDIEKITFDVNPK